MKILKLLPVIFLAITFVSCGPPDTYERGEQLYLIEKYDSAMYYFDRLLLEDGEWYDSSKVMKQKCLEKMVEKHFWKMLSNSFNIYQNDTSLVNRGNGYLDKELKRIIDMDSTRLFYEIFDNYKLSFPLVLQNVSTYYQDKVFTGYEWNGTKSVASQKIYFVREIVKNSNGKDEGLKIQAKSNKSIYGWTKNKVMYRNINYDSLGIYTMQPRIFQSGYYSDYEYFGKKGTMRIPHKDTLIFNYGQSLSGSNRVTFVRGNKLKN